MTVTIEKCDAHIRHCLGGPQGAPISTRELSNMAGEWLFSAHKWNFNKTTSTLLATRAEITLSGATWTDATKTLTKTGAFTDYSRLDEDKVRITAGTGATLGEYEITANDANTLTLATSIGVAADGQTDIEGALANNTIALPSDLRHIIHIDTNDGTAEGFSWQSEGAFSNGRVGRWTWSFSAIHGVIVATQPAAGGAISYRLEIDPEQSGSIPTLYMRYSVGWRAPDKDTDALPLPADGSVDSLYVQALLAHAEGYDRPEEMKLHERLAELRDSKYFKQIASRDGTKKTSFGPVNGSGIVYRGSNYIRGRHRRFVQGD